MNRVLVLFAHPAFHKSRVHRVLTQEIRSLDGVTFHDLYEQYPHLDIDVEEEQKLLVAHDVIVFQHPLFWYSIPAILKEWQDLVLEHGWAYGTNGNALEGKKWIHTLTTGGREAAYKTDGFNGHTIRDFLVPLEQTARLCKMEFLAPFVVHGTHLMEPEQMAHHAREYRLLVEGLRDNRVDWTRLKSEDQLSGVASNILTALTDGVSNG